MEQEERYHKFDFNIVFLILSSVLTLMTILTVPIYLYGYFFNQGYLAGYNIADDFFPRSIHEHLVNAFVAFLWIAEKMIELFDGLPLISKITPFLLVPILFIIF